MKKINTIWYGGKVILMGIVFTFAIPFCIRILPLKSNIIHMFSKISFVLGIIILIGFAIWLAIELHQDKKLNKYYYEHKNTILKIGKDKYECQSCGNRNVRPDDKSCSVCGIHFKNRSIN